VVLVVTSPQREGDGAEGGHVLSILPPQCWILPSGEKGEEEGGWTSERGRAYEAAARSSGVARAFGDAYDDGLRLEGRELAVARVQGARGGPREDDVGRIQRGGGALAPEALQEGLAVLHLCERERERRGREA